MNSYVPSEQRDAILESSRRSMHRHVKRKWDTPVSCKQCKRFHIISNKTISYLCPHCGKYNSAHEANERYEAGDVVREESKRSKNGVPAIKSIDSGKREYYNLRDEYEIRADFFSQGKTRSSMGVDKFNNTLKQELIKNKCYRGEGATGV